VNGETGATVGTVDVSHTTHTNARTYTSDYWSFTGTANYNNIGNTTITDYIGPRDALVNYIGQTTFVTSGTSATTAQVTLSASVQDPTGTALVGATMVPQPDGSVLYVKSSSISSMAVAGAPGNKTATIYTKSAVYKVLASSVTTIDGNVTLRMDVSDNGMSDYVGFTVLSSKDSTLYYSNNWLLSGTTWNTVLELVNSPEILNVN
jgi:hypothetical protein